MSIEEQTQHRELEIRAVRKDKREIDFVASTETVDSYGTVLKANWDFKRYERNPVVLWSHKSSDLPLGTAKTSVAGTEMLATVRFSEINPFAETVFQMALAGEIRGISVGFYPREVREEKHDDKWIVILDDNELRELSVCSVPSNPDALAKLRMRAAPRTDDQKTEAHGAPKTPATERGEARKDISMSPEEIAALKKLSEDRAAEVNTVRGELLTARSSITALETQNAKLVTERDAANTRASKAEEADLVRHVDSFLGKKFLPAEREDQLELARSNRPLFDKLIKQRSDLPIKIETTVMGDAKPEERTHADVTPANGADDGEADWAATKASIKKGGA